MEFDKLLKLVVEKGASDLFITAGMPPCIKMNGQMVPVTKGALSPEQSREIVLSVIARWDRPFGQPNDSKMESAS